MINHNTADLIKQHLNFNCSICFQQYNISDHYPYEICPNSHSVCEYCLRNHLQKSINAKCPQCRQLIRKYNVKKFPKRLTDQIISITQKVKKRDEQNLLIIKTVQDELKRTQRQLTLVKFDNQNIHKKSRKHLQQLTQTLSELIQIQKQQIQLYSQNIQLKKNLLVISEQNVTIKIILVYVIVMILVLINMNEVDYVDSLQQNRIINSSDDLAYDILTSNNQLLSSIEQTSSKTTTTTNNNLTQQQFNIINKQQKITQLIKQIALTKAKRYYQLQFIKLFITNKSQYLSHEIINQCQLSYSLNDMEQLLTSVYQYKEEFTIKYQEKLLLFDAQLKRTQQLVKDIQAIKTK